ncbi:MAG: 30S ribosomal protein S8 [Bacteroidetes bacterium]|nr:30S ribosomal protein S8 [Bacteroidota bacterium]MBX7046408.1 30S ribosomal protein S8 [Ignavibacteria bacterium]
MAMSDPIADYLTRVRNAIKARKRTVDIPASKFKKAISDILKNSYLINDYNVSDAANKNVLTIQLKYADGESVIQGLRRISKPGIRKYVSAENLPRVRNGLGIAIISTSKGLMTDKKARELKVGGEVVCEIW